MTDYFTTQLTGSKCAPFNCAAASGAMGLAAGTGNDITLTADEFRTKAAVSCVPGAHSTSGGLFISDVVRVFGKYQVKIDYGQMDQPPGYTRWAPATLATRCSQGEGAVVLGDYDQLSPQWRASATFKGDHSVWVHDFRNDRYCWHDPLRSIQVRIPASEVIRYWQKPNSPVRGYAGFVVVEGAEQMTYDVLPGAVTGTLSVKGTGHYYLRLADDTLNGPLDPNSPDWKNRSAYGPLRMKGGKLSGSTVYQIGTEAAFLLQQDVTFTPTVPKKFVAIAVNGTIDKASEILV